MALLIFSPHLDDAVFACGELMAQHPGAQVVTVFASSPVDFCGVTPWDAASGFNSAQQAIAQRRMEDTQALSRLAAHPAWLDFCDSQYGTVPPRADLHAHLSHVLRDSDAQTVLLPAGLFHSDHVLLHQILISMYAQHSERTWLMYEDALYRRIPRLLQQRLSVLADVGISATPFDFPHEARLHSAKRQAVACYASQLRALADAAHGYADVFMPERYWRLAANELNQSQDLVP
jgi:LmbE family N-acetylglucosaminyl deacetylase